MKNYASLLFLHGWTRDPRLEAFCNCHHFTVTVLLVQGYSTAITPPFFAIMYGEGVWVWVWEWTVEG